jgi:hypothetical protein
VAFVEREQNLGMRMMRILGLSTAVVMGAMLTGCFAAETSQQAQFLTTAHAMQAPEGFALSLEPVGECSEIHSMCPSPAVVWMYSSNDGRAGANDAELVCTRFLTWAQVNGVESIFESNDFQWDYWFVEAVFDKVVAGSIPSFPVGSDDALDACISVISDPANVDLSAGLLHHRNIVGVASTGSNHFVALLALPRTLHSIGEIDESGQFDVTGFLVSEMH